jgi:hypothetical protein
MFSAHHILNMDSSGSKSFDINYMSERVTSQNPTIHFVSSNYSSRRWTTSLAVCSAATCCNLRVRSGIGR